MSSIFQTHTVRNTLRWLTVSLGMLSLLIIAYSLKGETDGGVAARLLPDMNRGVIPWKTITAAEVMSGTTVPPNINVIIHIPEKISRITRKTLFGFRGDDTRYWGYCFPHSEEEAYALSRRGFPGHLFLSEAEREYRRQEEIRKRRDNFTIYRDLEEDVLNEKATLTSTIRHQLEVFKGGNTCYVMTEESIPVGSDVDEDNLNAALEDSFGVDSLNPDTDGDGIEDGVEVFWLGSHPNRRDSDGDGLIDGIEDANQNGRIDEGDTNPMELDSDRDGLCDGLCKVNNGLDLRGEDKNLNGIYEPDKGEYDPRYEDSDGDYVLDEHEVYLCVIGGGDDC